MPKDSMWNRMCKGLLPKAWQARPAVNVELNTTRLGRLDANDPTYNLILDHLLAQFANDLEVVLDPSVPDAARLAAANSVVGMRRALLDLEGRRAGWNLEREKEEKEDKEPVGQA